jgi:anti-sigma B factor antagonist
MEQIKLGSTYASQAKDTIIVNVGGYVDQSNSHHLQQIFGNIIKKDVYKVVVDFSELFYMSSAGWGIFVGEVKHFRDNGGDIRLAAMNADINEVFQMLEFYHILKDYPTVDEAVASFMDDEPLLDLVKEDSTAEVKEETKTEESADGVGEIFVPGYKRKHKKKDTEDKKKPEKADVNLEEENSEPIVVDPTPKPEIDLAPKKLEHTIRLADLPLSEKIRRVVAENPLLGLLSIRRVLRQEHFGSVKVGYFRLWRMLKQLDLDNRVKRYRYYRSC